MIQGEEPRRLIADSSCPNGLRTDLELAARDPGLAFDVEAGLARFEASIAAPAAAVPTASATPASSSLGLWTTLGGALVAGGVAVALWLASDRPPPGTDAAYPAIEIATPPPEEPITSQIVVPTQRPAARRVLPEAPASDETPEAQAAQPDGIPSKPRSRGKVRPVAAPAVPHEGGPDDRYLREVRELHRARSALETDPETALTRARAGLKEFSDGALGQEWEGVVVLALYELDREDEAAERARAYLKRYPEGPFAARVRRAMQQR